MVELLDQLDPDVVAAQELGPNMAETISGRLAHGLLSPALDFQGAGIALKYAAPVASFPMGTRLGLHARLQPDTWPELSSPVELLSVHLTNPLDRPWSTSRRSRRRQLEAILDRIPRDRTPLVAVGDFNATPRWPAYRTLRRGLRDGVAELGRNPRTWAPMPWMPPLLRIDHAFVHGAARIVRSEAVVVRGSDHRGLLIDVAVDG
jgi:endonuclease/exonuclease/phosphatase family metal-dependent hydrolase